MHDLDVIRREPTPEAEPGQPNTLMEARGEPEEGHALYVQFIGKQGFCLLRMSATTGPHFQGSPAVEALARRCREVHQIRGKVSLGS